MHKLNVDLFYQVSDVQFLSTPPLPGKMYSCDCDGCDTLYFVVVFVVGQEETPDLSTTWSRFKQRYFFLSKVEMANQREYYLNYIFRPPKTGKEADIKLPFLC